MSCHVMSCRAFTGRFSAAEKTLQRPPADPIVLWFQVYSTNGQSWLNLMAFLSPPGVYLFAMVLNICVYGGVCLPLAAVQKPFWSLAHVCRPCLAKR
jgi:hypothetical protein